MTKTSRNRRQFLRQSIATCGGLSIAGWLPNPSITPLSCTLKGFANSVESPLAAHHPATAKRVIFLFMHGGVSHVDTFDYKPRLHRDDGKDLPFELPPNISAKPRLMKGPWKFKQSGECGLWASELLPEMRKRIDDLCIIRSMHTRGQSHGQAVGMINTGSDNFVRPSLGAWISYALGSGHPDLPAHVAIGPATAHGGPRNYGAAFLPAIHQATAVGKNGTPGSGQIANLNGPIKEQHLQSRFDLTQHWNQKYLDRVGSDHQIQGAMDAMDLAERMRVVAPDIFDLGKESKSTKERYGVGTKPTDAFARSCLLARRLATAGVRFITVSSGQVWDQHGNLKSGHEKNAAKTDLPVAALIEDLKEQGLLDDTLLVWGSEFGRTPVAQGANGRDHNPQGYSMVLAGGGMKRGFAYGQTDEYGYYSAVDRVHVHDLHATILHALGMDHERLTYRYAGRDFRLTDVHGRVVKELFAS